MKHGLIQKGKRCMKEFNKLLQYRAYYEYDFECEVIRVAQGDHHDEAQELYAHLVHDFCMRDSDKWAFDIALDCIRNFKDEECEFIKSHGEIFDYHLGYGMYVRNKYVHPSKLHIYLMADNVSSDVAGFLYTILLPVYNCLSEKFMKLIGDYNYNDIKAKYGDAYPIIAQMEEKLADWRNQTTAEEAMKIIVNSIRDGLGKDGFKNIFLSIIQEHINQHKRINAEWNSLIDKLYSNTRVFRKEYNQFKAIHEMGLTMKIAKPYPSIHTVDEASEYIQDNLGLSKEDSLLMAECFVEAVKIQDAAN